MEGGGGGGGGLVHTVLSSTTLREYNLRAMRALMIQSWCRVLLTCVEGLVVDLHYSWNNLLIVLL